MKPFTARDEACPSAISGILDVIQDGIVVFDRDFNIVWANHWAEQRYADRAPLVGKKCYEVFTDLAEPRPDCPFVSCLEKGDVHNDILAYRSPEGDLRRFEMSIYRLEDGEGRATGAVGHIKDTTDQKRTEEMLRDEGARESLLVDQSRDGIVVLDEEGRVFETNHEFAHMLGYPMAEMPALHVWDWESQVSKEEVLEMLKSVDDKGDHFESRHRRKDGSFYEVEISTNGLVHQGKKFVFCICRDITERKQNEREREALIKSLQEASAQIKALEGILPLCSYCKRIRVGEDEWEQVDVYLPKHSEADISHGVCPECMQERFPDL